METKTIRVRSAALKHYCAALFRMEGVPASEAEITADVLVEANLTGVDSHGITRVPAYLERLRKGGCARVAEITTLRDFPAGASWDARGSLGQVAAHRAMQTAIEKAKTCGVGFVTLKGNNHTGANAYYVKMAVQAGMIGLAAGNGAPMVAPWGSATAFFSTNPLSFGVPAGNEAPVIIDMATSVSARGKIILAAKNGTPIPLGWATDPQGNDTQDPVAALKGVLLPFGGHKGYAIALMVEVLAGLLSGAGCGPDMNDPYSRPDLPINGGNLFAAVDVCKFTSLETFKTDTDSMIHGIREGRPRPGVSEILLPGQIEARNRAERLENGIPISVALLDELNALGAQHGLGSLAESEE